MAERPKGPRGKSLVTKRSIRLDGHRTSVSLETAFWDELKSIADAQGTLVGQLIAAIDSERHERQYLIFRPQSVYLSLIIIAAE